MSANSVFEALGRPEKGKQRSLPSGSAHSSSSIITNKQTKSHDVIYLKVDKYNGKQEQVEKSEECGCSLKYKVGWCGVVPGVAGW